MHWDCSSSTEPSGGLLSCQDLFGAGGDGVRQKMKNDKKGRRR